MFILAFLILALITGVLSFGGFVAGGLLLVFQILFFLFLLGLIGSLVRGYYYKGPRR